MIRRTMLGVVVAAAFCLPAAAQMQQQGMSGFHSVACVKVKPEKVSEFRAWAASDLHKYEQSRVDTGALSAWSLLPRLPYKSYKRKCQETYLSVGSVPTLFCFGIQPNRLNVHS